MTTQHWLPVRCCCTPDTIYGFLRLPGISAGPDNVVIKDREGVTHEIKIRVFVQDMRPTATKLFDTGLDAVTYISTKSRSELAVYSDDRTQEFWHRFEGFMPVGSR